MSRRGEKIETHFEPPLYFSLTKAEIDQLKDKTRIPEKENTYFLVGLAIPSLFGLFTLEREPLSWIYVLHCIVFVVSFLMAILQAKGWADKRGQFAAFIKEIEGKPRVEMQVSRESDAMISVPTTPTPTPTPDPSSAA